MAGELMRQVVPTAVRGTRQAAELTLLLNQIAAVKVGTVALDRFRPRSFRRPHISDRLRQTHPLDDAKIARDTRRRGIALSDPGLVWPASRGLVVALTSAVLDPRVPDPVTEDVAKLVLSEDIASPGISVVAGQPTNPDQHIPDPGPGFERMCYADVISPTVATATRIVGLMARHVSDLDRRGRLTLYDIASNAHQAVQGSYLSPA